MATPFAHTRWRGAGALAAAALAGEVTAWWWVAQPGDPGHAPVLLGAAGIVLAFGAGLLAVLQLRETTRALAGADAAMARALEHGQALQQSLASERRTFERLVAGLDALPLGLAVFDRQGRWLVRNGFINRLLPGIGNETANERINYERLQQLEQSLGVRIDDDAQATMAAAAEQGSVLQYPGERWMLAHDMRTAHGVTAVARIDVSALARAEHRANEANARLSRQSATDGLTGIANRRHFDSVLASEWQRAARGGSCLSLLIVDIDHFKRYNDHYGHVAGDECLRRVAQILSACVRRAGEVVARYGGEEFVVLLPASDVEHAVELAERCLAQVAQDAMPHAASPTAAHVTFSIGIANVFPSAGHEPESLVNAADAAMYRAKAAGRARHAVADLADWEIDKDTPRTRPGELT